MNGTMMQFFEWYIAPDGNFWNHLEREVPKLASKGITAVWLPPAYKGMKGAVSEGYDVYDIYDLGEFNQRGTTRTKYGTKQEYVQAVEKARRYGIHVYIDVVLNHKGGGDETERIKVKKAHPENRNEFISDVMEVEAFTKFHFPGRKGKHSQFVWDHHCFTGIDHAYNLQEDGVFKIENGYDGWEEVICDEKGNYDFLILADIEFRNEAVRNELKRWIKWYYDTVEFDGFRLDAVKHMPAYFYNEWIDYARADVKEDLFIVGEYWSSHLSNLLRYIDATQERMSLFDAPLQAHFHEASKAGSSYNLSTIFHNTLVAVKPCLAVTLVENHDTQPCQGLEAPVEAWFKPLAYALILLREQGYPCVFYTDMYGTEYTDKRYDGNDCHVEMKPVEALETMLMVRKNYAYGKQRDYFDHYNCIGWTREGNLENEFSGCAVLMCNGFCEGIKLMKIGKKHAGKTFVDCLKNHNGEVVIDENGLGQFYCLSGSVSVWVQKQ
jgi:alpha-amylase